MVDVDTFLVAVSTVVDTLYQRELAPCKPHRRGHRPEMADSEILTLLLIGQWLGTSERGLLRYVDTHWRDAFPRLLDQSAFNRRARLGGSLYAVAAPAGAGAGQRAGALPGGRWLLDALVSWRADPAAELWTVADIPTRRKRRQDYVGPTGPRWWPDSAGTYGSQPYLADGGFTGVAWQTHWRTDAGATVVTLGPGQDR